MFIGNFSIRKSGTVRHSVLITSLLLSAQIIFAQDRTDSISDSSRVLKKVTVLASVRQNTYTVVSPVQILNHEKLQQINAVSIADGAKYFSGVLIKDYGGVGGLKTISVRGLGTQNTGLMYDGIPVADAQTGQSDLSKFSATFVQSLELDQANPQQALIPARAYASASILSVQTHAIHVSDFGEKKWQAGVRQGSFGLVQAEAGFYLPVYKKNLISANAEVTTDNGNYPFYTENGILSQKEYRANSDIKSFQGEINWVSEFRDSSRLQTKAWSYISARGLPGSLIFFNDISVQRLWDRDFFVQSRYQKKIDHLTSLLVSAKYSSLFTRYRDPNFLNNAGGLDDRYTQQEYYLSLALSRQIGKKLDVSLASDIASTHLSANISPFATPTRTSIWSVFSMQYTSSHWQLNGSLLYTGINDKVASGTVIPHHDNFAANIAGSYKLSTTSPFLFRVFYKDNFRMPTFNDLYYTFINNVYPKLRPEYSRQYNAGVTFFKNIPGSITHVSVSADGYYNNVRDKIIAVPSQNLFIWTMTNLGRVHITGIDINGEANGRISPEWGWSAQIASTWQRALDYTDPSSTEYKNKIPYTPDFSGSLLVSVNNDKWNGGYGLLFSSDRYTLGENNPANEVPGWGTSEVFIDRLLTLVHFQAKIRAGVDNIFDKRYDVIRYYPMPGRSYKVSITFNNL